MGQMKEIATVISQLGYEAEQGTIENINMLAHTLVGLTRNGVEPEPEHKTAADGEKLYPRRCETCNKGMAEGYLGEAGGTWCSDECLFTGGYTKEMYQKDFENDACYYTDWDFMDVDDEGFCAKGRSYLWDEETQRYRRPLGGFNMWGYTNKDCEEE